MLFIYTMKHLLFRLLHLSKDNNHPNLLKPHLFRRLYQQFIKHSKSVIVHTVSYKSLSEFASFISLFFRNIVYGEFSYAYSLARLCNVPLLFARSQYSICHQYLQLLPLPFALKIACRSRHSNNKYRSH